MGGPSSERSPCAEMPSAIAAGAWAERTGDGRAVDYHWRIRGCCAIVASMSAPADAGALVTRLSRSLLFVPAFVEGRGAS